MISRSLAFTCLYLLIYILLSFGVILYNKWVLSPKYFNFPLPITLTMIHMGFSGLVSFLLVRVFKLSTAGGRLIVASDGVWDAISFEATFDCCLGMSPEAAVAKIIKGFLTDNERALEELFGDEDNHKKGDTCLNVMATRIATVFASLWELPFVRYRTSKSLDANTITTYRDLVPTKLAARVWNCLSKYKTTISNFPQTETCELLILDRMVDQIAPIIHEWTYDAMCHDLLNIERSKYVHELFLSILYFIFDDLVHLLEK